MYMTFEHRGGHPALCVENVVNFFPVLEKVTCLPISGHRLLLALKKIDKMFGLLPCRVHYQLGAV